MPSTPSGESRIAARGGGTPARREAAVDVRNCAVVAARKSYAVAPTKERASMLDDVELG